MNGSTKILFTTALTTCCLCLLLQHAHGSSDETPGFNCNITKPGTWLRTIGRGLLDWGHAGVPLGGASFCFTGCYATGAAMVAYDVQLSNQESAIVSVEKQIIVEPNMNACDYNDTKIKYCIAFCSNTTLKNQAISTALTARLPSRVAQQITAQQSGNNFVAVVLQVNLNAQPEARLIADVFLDPAWCSIYIYIQNTGFPYLFEIQMARVKMS